MWNRVLVTSLAGWWVGQWDLYRSSPCVFSIVSKFDIGKDDFYTNLVWKSFEFWRISRRDRVGKNTSDFFIYFFLRVQCLLCQGQCIQFSSRKTGDNGNAMFPKKVRISKIPAKRFLYRSLWAQVFEKKVSTLKFSKPPKKTIPGSILGQDRPEKNAAKC